MKVKPSEIVRMSERDEYRAALWFLLDRAELKLTPDWAVVIGDGKR